MTLILSVFDKASVRLTLEEVAAATHLPRSTTHRILEQLVHHHWVVHAQGHYGLGSRALSLAAKSIAQDRVRTAAAAVLHRLALHSQTEIQLGTLHGHHVHLVDTFGRPTPGTTPPPVGTLLPTHCTALGKALLSALPPEAVDPGHLHPRTRHTITDLDTLRVELTRIRRRHGLAFDRGEYLPHLACAAAVIVDGAQAVGAVSVSCPTPATSDRLAPLVVGAAQTIGRRLRNPGHPAEGRAPAGTADPPDDDSTEGNT
ncbi:MAG: IclR family transcriptional regulator [Gordonia sp. (in: high G+C Gram-positive bacteria)]